jgi:hypothetical protein
MPETGVSSDFLDFGENVLVETTAKKFSAKTKKYAQPPKVISPAADEGY